MRLFSLGIVTTLLVFAVNAWVAGLLPRGRALTPQLRALYDILAVNRNCDYIPDPRKPAHRFVADVRRTFDGSFIIAHYFNRGISELSVIAYDAKHHRYVRAGLAKDGSWQVLDSAGPVQGSWVWRSVESSVPSALTTITPQRDGSYRFQSTDAAGYGFCTR